MWHCFRVAFARHPRPARTASCLQPLSFVSTDLVWQAPSGNALSVARQEGKSATPGKWGGVAASSPQSSGTDGSPAAAPGTAELVTPRAGRADSGGGSRVLSAIRGIAGYARSGEQAEEGVENQACGWPWRARGRPHARTTENRNGGSHSPSARTTIIAHAQAHRRSPPHTRKRMRSRTPASMT